MQASFVRDIEGTVEGYDVEGGGVGQSSRPPIRYGTICTVFVTCFSGQAVWTMVFVSHVVIQVNHHHHHHCHCHCYR